MKKLLLLLTFCLSSLSFALPIQDHKIDQEALEDLCHNLNISTDADIIAETQKHWLRKSGKERFEMSELPEVKKDFVLNFAKAENFFSAWKPNLKIYDKALVLGATTIRMQMRLDYLKQLWNEGVRFNEIVWLTGDRPLDKLADEYTDRCSNESEASRIVFEETDLPLEMRALPVVYVAVPMIKDGSKLKRPNTEDTIVAWLEVEKNPCTALFISDQPFCGYQFSVIKSNLPSAYLFDVAGPAVDDPSHPAAAAIILDTVARWLYQESLRVTFETKE